MNLSGEPKRRGLALTIIGALLMFLVAPAVFITGTVLGVKGGIDIVSKAPLVPSGGSITLQQNEVRDVYAYDGVSSSDNGVDANTTYRSDLPSCAITGPDGAKVEFRPPAGNIAWTRDSVRYRSAGSFTATQAGSYQVTCGDHPTVVPSADDAQQAANHAVWWIGIALAIATVFGVLGLILLIVGIVKLVNSGKERSRHRLAMQQRAWQGWQQGPPRW